MAEECCNKERKKSGLARATSYIGTGLIAHSTICPCIPGLLLKAGLVTAGAIAPFEATNRYLVDTVTPVVANLRGDDKDYSNLPEFRMNRKTRELVYVDPNKEIANYIVEGAGWTILGGIVLLVGASLYKNRRKGEIK